MSQGHARLEKNIVLMSVFIVIVVSLGGLLVLGGMFIMIYNVWKTIAAGSSARDVPVMAPAAA